MQEYVTELRSAIEHAGQELALISDAACSRRPGPNKWSKKEIVGHLIDSAAHNHQRFVRARFQTELVFPGYDQDDWVRAQRYQEAQWRPLVDLWRSYNVHIAHVMASTPTADLHRDDGTIVQPPDRARDARHPWRAPKCRNGEPLLTALRREEPRHRRKARRRHSIHPHRIARR